MNEEWFVYNWTDTGFRRLGTFADRYNADEFAKAHKEYNITVPTIVVHGRICHFILNGKDTRVDEY